MYSIFIFKAALILIQGLDSQDRNHSKDVSQSTSSKDRATDIGKWWSIYVSLEESKVIRLKLNKSNSLIGK